MIGKRELLGLCKGISLLPGDRTRIAGGCDEHECFRERDVLEALEKLARRTADAGVRLDLTPGLMERFLGISKPNKPSQEWFLSRKDLGFVWDAALETKPRALGLSISHTKGAWLAAARGLDADGSALRTARVGIDIEIADRPVSDRLLQRFSNPDDSCPGVTRIGLWAAKEALFKADAESGSRTLRDYAVTLELQEEGIYSGVGTLPSGEGYAACVVGSGPYVLAAVGDTSRPVR